MTAFDRLKFLCERQGISVNDLEEKIGIGKNSLYSWKKNTPKGTNLLKVADYFRVSTDYLLGRTDNPNLDSSKVPKEIDVKDDTVIMTYGGKPLSDSDREIVLAATRALVEQRAREEEERKNSK
jgi:transcriptional regulator with XRE-family HTH domain